MVRVKEFRDKIKDGILKELATSQCNDFIRQTNCSVIDIKYQVINTQGDYCTALLLIYNDDDDYRLGGSEYDIMTRFTEGAFDNAGNYVS